MSIMDPNEKLREVCKRVYGQACVLPCSWPEDFSRAISEMRDIIAEPAPSPSAPPAAVDAPGDEVLDDLLEAMDRVAVLARKAIRP